MADDNPTYCPNCEGRTDRPGLYRCREAIHPAPDLAQRIAAEIERDLNARRGIGIEPIDPDLQYEIRDRWAELIREELRRSHAGEVEGPR